MGVALLVALGGHLALGWPASALGGIVVGLMQGAWAVWAGGAVVAVAWLGLIGYNLVRAPSAVGRMLSTVGGIFGGLPAWTTALATVAVGFALGAVGAWVGLSIRRAVQSRRAVPNQNQQ